MSATMWHNSSLHSTMEMLMSRVLSPGCRQSDMFLRRRYAMADELYWKDLVGHFGCVNAIEFSHGLGQYIASGGDDRRVLLWNVEKALSNIGQPTAMKGEHNSNIFCIAFDRENKTAFSGGNDEQVIVHDLTTGETKDVFTHEDAVYGLSPDPTNPNVFASACDDGRVLIFDTRDSCADPFCLANYMSSMHSVMYNPMEPRLLATANAKEGVALWDVRKPRSCVLRYGGNFVQQSCMSVSFNHRGDQVVALRRRLPPVLYSIHDNQPLCEFDHSRYYNSCTMKSICFAGDNDQYVVSGSDEFNLYMWAIPEDLSERQFINSAHLVLKGHRSIVNQVRFNPANHLLISSGVEKVVKVWSPFQFPEKNVVKSKGRFRERPVFSHEEYINLILQDGNMMTHDYSEMSTAEDPRMMAFFDSLVQRELEGWSSDDSLSSNEEALYSRIVQLSQSDIDSDDSLVQAIDGGNNRDEDPSFSPFTITFASVMASQAVEGNDRYPQLTRALEEVENSRNQDTEARLPPREETSRDSEARRRDIATLVKKKKKELKVMVARQLKYTQGMSEASSSSSCSDLSDTDDEDKADSGSDEDGIQKTQQGNDDEENNLTVINENNRIRELKKVSQERLKRLKALRQTVLKNDSENEDGVVERHVTSTVTGVNNTDDSFEEARFKRLKMNVCSVKLASAKVPTSSDFGPYLQRTQASSPTGDMVVEESDKSGKISKTSDKSKLKGKRKRPGSSDLDGRCSENRTKESTKRDSNKNNDSSCNCGKNKLHSHNESVCNKKGKRKLNENTEFKQRHAKKDHRKGHVRHCRSKLIKETLQDQLSLSDSDSSVDASLVVTSAVSGPSCKSSMSTDQPVASCSYNDGKGHKKGKSGKKNARVQEAEAVTGKDKNSSKKTDETFKKRSTSSKNREQSSTKKDDTSGNSQTDSKKRGNDSSSENEAPTWTEFKRFKNKVKRAQRHYRAHTKRE